MTKHKAKNPGPAAPQLDAVERVTKTAEQIGLTANPGQRIPTVRPALQTVSDNPLQYRIVSDKTVLLDHAKAAEYVDLGTFHGERMVTNAAAQKLYDHMIAGTFNFSSVTMASAWLSGTQYKVNGQHTAWAVILMPDTFVGAPVREVIYEVDTPEQLRALYSTFDAGKARTPDHVTKVLLSGSDLNLDVPSFLLGKLASAYRLWKFPLAVERRRVTPQQAATLIMQQPKLTRVVAEFLADIYTDCKHLVRVPTIAAMYATMDKLPLKGGEFWQPVANGIGLDSASDPRSRLRQWLQQVTRRRAGDAGMAARRELVSEEEMYRACIAAWNKWRTNETLPGAPVATRTRMAPI